ncbi:hypothetical protein DEU56DRAFT_256352 [Suillus clintonianus]|uniref:uncharacterized protein n=1 Tax=Suillus clintonianus TaxID=1904413 RepID=UPI001B87CAE7|nr:uncharacterized protein DEU56DRAFT_256352 [Suillus clintonianus]KAG2143063.1 hypothetical protein DEU56DRAFT_256352 [Suillus clintonianus]
MISNVPETALLSLQVCARRHIHSDEYIGMVGGTIGAFLQDSGCHDGQLVVFDKQSKRNPETRLSFRMTRSSSCYGNESCRGSVHSPSTQSRDCSPQQHVDDAVRAVVVSPTPKGGMQGNIESLSVQAAQVFVRDTSDTFQLLLSRISIFVKIARAFAEAHPYTKMALMVLTAGHEVIQRQLARDDRIQQLTLVMCESYGLVSDAPDLHNFHSQAETINLLARQTIECAYFIRDYAIHKSGLKHAFANVFSNIDTTIQDYETAFRKIRIALEQQAVINTQLVVFRIHDVLKDLAAKEDLKALPYTTGVAYHAQGSRVMPPEENHVNEVSDWVNDKNSPAIYLLIGPHRSENSAVAYAVADQFDKISRLGSSYCFGRTCKKRAANLFSTIARDLADHNPEFMTCLGDKVKRRSIGSSPHIPTQFEFILAPAQQLESFGPVLVVIDALDACVDSLAEVVSVLKEKAQYLPPNFKFLITCLPETDVAIALRDQHHVLSKELDVVVTGQSRDNEFIAGRTKPRPLTPPIKTTLSQPDYFSSNGSAVSVASSSSVSSFAPSIFDEGLPFNPDASSPASSITSCTDAGPPKRFVSTIKHTKTKENSIFFDQSGVPQTVTHTIMKQTVKQHVTSTPRRVPSYAPMLDEPNAPLFTPDLTTLAGDTFMAVPAQRDSPRPLRHKRTPNRQETIIRNEMQTTGPQPITLLSL